MTNRKLKGMALGLTLVLSLGMLAGCGGEKKAEQKKTVKVGIVQLVEHAALDAANKGFVDGMAANGFKEKENVTYDRQNAQADQSNLQNIAQRFVSNKVDLICAIATPSAQTMANATKDIPIVGTAITDYEAAKLVASNKEPKGNVTGTTDMNPIKEQAELMLKIVPQAKTVGAIYSSSEVNSQIQIKILKEVLAAKNIKVVEATVSTVNDIQQAAQSLVGKVDAVYAPTDNVIASAMPTLIGITNEAKIPVFCGESGMLKAGGIATVGIDYYKLGVQTGAMAARILSGKAKPAAMPIESQKEMQTVVNEEAAKKLGIVIPADVIKAAKGSK
ncbi:MAG: ABC transporter substrate-binding protein [Acholeplasmataceae bacterium]|nr:ABC transporter substrate-binding protein [Acidaminococcaceae bacterium]NLY84362.1 ABC transporter substrate-binding protein [Acholeplasmataceae bacterium]